MKLKIDVEFRLGGVWPIRRSFSMDIEDALEETISGLLLALVAKGGWQATDGGATWRSGQFSLSISMKNA